MMNEPGYKTTELWLTAIVGAINTILVTTVPTSATIVLVVSLSVVAITYLISRTTFKIAKLKLRPDEVVAFKSHNTTPRQVISEDHQ
tara:strand:- start:456 stop:716 length:261 start_codon:yes stop_codon:yes gene_type:complete